MYQFLKRIAAVVLCVILLVSSAMADAVSVSPSAKVTLHKAPYATQSDVLDFNVITPVPPVKDNLELNKVVNSFFDTETPLPVGQVGGAKNVDPENVASGIVKVDLDTVYHSQGVDVAFVLDRSGSMNMWVEEIDNRLYSYIMTTDDKRNNHISPHNVPCMNPEHYYEINYTIEGQAEKHVYEYCPVKNGVAAISWYTELNNFSNQEDTEHSENSKLENEIEAFIRKEQSNNELEVVITSIGRHMKKVTGTDNEGNPIETREEIEPDYLTDSEDQFGFSSPAADLENGYRDANGCYDRSMLARYMIWQFVKELIAANPDNRVAFTTFAKDSNTNYTQSFSKDISSTGGLYTKILKDRGGAQHTNYTAGFQSAASLFGINLNNTQAAGKVSAPNKKILIFVSDGAPSVPDELKPGTGVNEAVFLQENDVEIYAIGVNSGATNDLKAVASNPKETHAGDFKTAEGFISFFNEIMKSIVNKKKVTLSDTLGENYELLVSEQYPVTLISGDPLVADIVMDTEEKLAANGVVYDPTTRTLTKTVETTKYGMRLSFYAQLDESKRNPSESGVVHYPTNTDMTYQPEGGQSTHVSVSDKLIVSHTVLTAVKDNGDMKDKTVHPSDIIPYTITVKNENGFDLTGLVVTDIIPEGTEYVKNSASDGGVYDEANQKLTFTAETIDANGEVSFKFNVKVLPGFNNIVNRATFTVNEAVDPATSTKLIAQTNEVVNPRGDVPQVKAVKSNGEMEGKAVKPGDVIPYTITLTNENEFALTNVKVTDVIPEGTEYVEDSANASGGTYDDQNNQVTFEAASIRAGESIIFTFKVKVLVGMNTIVNQASYSVAEIVKEDPKNPGTLIPEIFETNRVENPRGDVEISAVKSNGSMADKAVKPGDLIPYTIMLTNNNNVALTDLLVVDQIPEGTEYVKGSGGTYKPDNNLVVFTAESIAPNSNITFTFYVKVLEGTNVIVNKAYYSVAEIVVPNSDPDYPNEFVRVTFETNEVDNPRMVFTEEIPNVPQTGDNASPLVWALLAMLSLACITMLMNRKKA